MKSFLKFVAVLFVFIYVWQLFTGPDMHVVIQNQHVYSESIWFQALLIPFIALISVVALFVLFSVFGAFLVSIVVCGLVLIFVGLSLFWPTLIAVVVCYWLFSESKQKEVNDY